MSQAVEILSSKGLQLALQQQQPSPAASELPDFVTSRQDAWFLHIFFFFINILQLFWRRIGASSRMPS
jgi:hypothetical protein